MMWTMLLEFTKYECLNATGRKCKQMVVKLLTLKFGIIKYTARKSQLYIHFKRKISLFLVLVWVRNINYSLAAC